MTTNKFLNYNSSDNTNLYEDLLIEAIQIYGQDMIYIPRTAVKEDLLFGEDVLSKFEERYEMEMYLKNVDAFEGEGDYLSKFGLEIRNRATFIVSKKVFEVAVDGALSRPREGDLILFPMAQNKLFEIRFVEHEIPLWQLGTWNRYEMTVEAFAYSHENINTGLPEIDQIETIFAYQMQLTLAAGTGSYTVGETVYQGASLALATAKAEVVSFANNLLTVNNIIGEWTLASNVIGNSSGCTRSLSAIEQLTQHNATATTDNKRIETESAPVFFDANNPFGEP